MAGAFGACCGLASMDDKAYLPCRPMLTLVPADIPASCAATKCRGGGGHAPQLQAIKEHGGFSIEPARTTSERFGPLTPTA